MREIKFTKQERDSIVVKLLRYFEDELDQELGQFDGEFLLDFLIKALGPHFYNRGLLDAQVGKLCVGNFFQNFDPNGVPSVEVQAVFGQGVFGAVDGHRQDGKLHLMGQDKSAGFERLQSAGFRTGSFTIMSLIEKISKNMMVADLVAFIASLDIIAPEIDR